jgi:hypothetical protein
MWIETQWEKNGLYSSIHTPHPSTSTIHPSTTSIHNSHSHPSIHPLFFTLANFLIMQIREEEKEHKRNCSDTKS